MSISSIASVQEFLSFVTSIDLSEHANARIEVNGEITGSFEDTVIDPGKSSPMTIQ